MENYRSKLLALLLMACLSLQAWGQTDMTHLITNPDFEENGVTGWKTTGIGPQSNSSFRLKHGNTYAEIWTGRGSTLEDNHLLQTLTELPFGVYTITAVGHNIQEDTPTQKLTGAWLVAGNNRTQIDVDDEYSVTATAGDGTLTIGVELKNAKGNWFAVDYFRMSYEVVADSLQPFVLQLIAEAESIDQHLATAAQTELDEAVALLRTYVGSQQTEGLVAAMQRLKAAIKGYRLSLASPENPFDMTSAIVNPSFETNGTKGWMATDMGPQGNDSFRLKAGSIYVEKWTARGSYVGDGSVRQLVTNLPSGNYRLSCVAQNIQEDSPTVNRQGAWLFADEQQTPVYKTSKYEVDFTCITGKVEIGFEAKNAKGNWIAVDNFHLLYLGASEEANIAALSARITIAEELATKHQNADTLTVLTQALAAAKNYAEGQDLTSIASALEQAIDQSRASIDAYEQLHDAISQAQAVIATTAGDNGLATFEQAIESATATYDDLYQSNAALAAATLLLQRAIFVFRLENASGAVPIVTTHPEVIYGCKAAVGRMMVIGGNVLEQGFCWSTQPEPTVLDSTSTTYYEFNGKIFLMPDLQPSTTYYVRAYAMTKQYAVGYGDVVRIITLPAADVVYSYNMAGDDATNERIDNACKTAVYYLNTWTAIRGYRPSVNYDPGDDGAHGSYGGWITIGAAFAQNPGTVMHEMGHGIGVGQHWRYTSWDSPLHPTMYWTGERANRVFYFFENSTAVPADGDRVHVCYGLSGVTAPIDLLRQAAFYQGMYEDGLPAVGDGACPFYSFDCVEGEKYYLTNERLWMGQRFIMVQPNGKPAYIAAGLGEITADDNYAWYVNYEPLTGFYHIRNAQSGKYLTYNSGFTTRDVTTFTNEDNIQLMPSRKTATLSIGNEQTTVKPYWVARGNRVESPEVMCASSSSVVTSPQLNFYDSATQQHWVFLSASQVQEYLTGVREIKSEEGKVDGENIYDLQGRRMNTEGSTTSLKKGLYIIGGKKIIIK